MKIHVLSDLHVEWRDHAFQAPDTDADLVVLAGDIHRLSEGVQWAQSAFPGRRVLYVAGNHEFYDGDWDDVIPAIREQARMGGDQVRFLEQDEVIIDRVRFLGCTLWTDFDIEGESERQRLMEAAHEVLFDFRKIRSGNRKINANMVRDRHVASLRWLVDKLDQPFDGRTVVITHHLPHRQSIAARFASDPANGGFVSDLSALMGRCVLWIHGHTHDSFDYSVSGTRVVCNPRGYPLRTGGIENGKFDPAKVVEI